MIMSSEIEIRSEKGSNIKESLLFGILVMMILACLPPTSKTFYTTHTRNKEKNFEREQISLNFSNNCRDLSTSIFGTIFFLSQTVFHSLFHWSVFLNRCLMKHRDSPEIDLLQPMLINIRYSSTCFLKNIK